MSTQTETRETTLGRAYVIPDLFDLNAVQTFISEIVSDTGLRVEFKVETTTGCADVRIGPSLNALRVPVHGVILIIGTVVFALDALHLDDGVAAAKQTWGQQ